MTAYYNEIDPYAAQWLPNLIKNEQKVLARGRFAALFRSRLTETKSSAYLSRFEEPYAYSIRSCCRTTASPNAAPLR